jgi:tetratricopeptide (TPR) repeat protein
VSGNVGGQIQGISLDSFLQMVEMEKSSCTLKVMTEEDLGFIFISKGRLISAETGILTGMEAVCTIISWEDSLIEIDNSCERTENEINQPLMTILMEGLKLRDENKSQAGYKPKKAPLPKPETEPAPDGPPPAGGEAPHTHTEASGPDDGKPAVKRPPKPAPTVPPAAVKKKKIGKVPLIAAILVIAGVVAYFALSMFGGQEKSYKSVLAKVEQASDTGKISLLRSFIDANEPGEDTENAARRILEIQTEIEKSDFTSLKKRLADHMAAKNFEKAVSLYRHHLNKYPKSAFKGKINTQLKALTSKIETRDYAQLSDEAMALGADRIDLYLAYLKNHPHGKHFKEVEKLVEEMETEYFIHIEAQILDLDMTEDWKTCLALAKKYLTIYPASSHSGQLERLRTVWEEKIKEKRIFLTLKRSAENKGTDYAAAMLTYSNYLRSFPNSYMKDKVTHEMAVVQSKIDAQRLKAASEKLKSLLSDRTSRFLLNDNGTVTDKKTGLMWTEQEGLVVLDECLTYQEAVDYVKSLKTGGLSDWRLPTARELVGLYKNKPFFPDLSATWYWSSDTTGRYDDKSGWVKDVEIVSSANSTEWVTERKDFRNCGSVRAVRKP